MSRLLVSGATGFIGRHLVPMLVKQGHEVHAIIGHKPLPDALTRCDPQPKSIPWTGDPVALVADCTGRSFDAAIHLATCYRREHVIADIAPLVEANLLLGTALMEAMRQQPGRRVVNASTVWRDSGPDGEPVNLYAATKQAFSVILEHMARIYGLETVSLLIADSYGEDDTRPRFLNALQTCYRAGKPLLASGGEQIIDLLHVDDICRAIIRALEIPVERPFSEYSIPSGHMLSLRELVGRIEQALGKNLQVTWGARPYAAREVFRPNLSAPPLPGWLPQISLDEGMHRLFEAQGGD